MPELSPQASPQEVNDMDKELDSQDSNPCAICLQHQDKAFPLPCTCRMTYCQSCWSRALATSVTVKGRAQCPSCRVFFRVDFDPKAGGLSFTPDEQGTSASDWRAKLYRKARPAQIVLLKNFGARLKARNALARAGKLNDALEAISTFSSQAGPTKLGFRPVCVCGAFLERITKKERILRMLEDSDPSWEARVVNPKHLIDRLMASSLVTCDICDSVATLSGTVWTCANGSHTILHPAAYDICESCFLRHVGEATVDDCDIKEVARDDLGERNKAGCCMHSLPWLWGSRQTVPIPDASQSRSLRLRARRILGLR